MTADFNRFSNLVIVDDATGIRVSAPTSVLASMTHAARAGTIKSDSPMERGAAALLVNGLVSEVASRVGLVVSDKAAASAIPILGAIGGATVNLLFTEHVHTIAEAHVTRRRLERNYRIDRLQPKYAPAARPGTPLAV